ncbi:MoaD/ThiS family protein [Limnovirga soli]|uniref:Molybdopterin synthase sulfur carrier subunit n=1 Tax=Limnovirga soli TaxID=2656915 RepID=A0A8J8JSS7_9BACT|nr:MoaD/ThiS family protein [Limnovirga soli]NNV53914.1 molybdopterin synthase sulfur carrier subunit [Limnovirga soli]
MEITILAFGIAKDILGGIRVNITLNEPANIHALKQQLEHNYPPLKELASYMIAVNNNYASDTQTILSTDEIALIPPVSGG